MEVWKWISQQSSVNGHRSSKKTANRKLPTANCQPPTLPAGRQAPTD
jgi:hypothetical protein